MPEPNLLVPLSVGILREWFWLHILLLARGKDSPLKIPCTEHLEAHRVQWAYETDSLMY